MKIFLLIALSVAAVLAAPAEEINPSIVGGINALPNEFPYIVSIQYVLGAVSMHVCGGSIISPIFVISVANCLNETEALGRFEILAGKHNLGIYEDGQTRVGIEHSIIHHDWTGSPVGPDALVLIRLASPLTWSASIHPIRLPALGSIPTGLGTLAGWGSTELPDPPNILQKASLPTITYEACVDAINNLGLIGDLVDDSNFCTGPLTGGVAACTGDSGGPIVQGVAPNEILIGISSGLIRPCGLIGAPSGIFNRISAYNDWIFEHTGITN